MAEQEVAPRTAAALAAYWRAHKRRIEERPHTPDWDRAMVLEFDAAADVIARLGDERVLERLEASETLLDAAYTCAVYFQMHGRTDEQDWARSALDSALRALGADPDAHPNDEARIARALEAGRIALEKGAP